MSHQILQSMWKLAERQHGVVTRPQLLALGVSEDRIKHWIVSGRLHPVWRGVYAVGRPELGRQGRWMAAVLSCGPSAVLSHQSAAALWEIRGHRERRIHVSVPVDVVRRRRGIVVHRRPQLSLGDVVRHEFIPVTGPLLTLVDLASCVPQRELEAAINEADKRDLVDPETLRSSLERFAGWRGAAALRTVLDRHTFTLTDSELERLFLPIARKVGLPRPRTQQYVNGFRVDFFWPELGLIVETDGLRYHRTATQQATDRLRDQAHAAAGLTSLRFTHAQVKFDPRHVETTLGAVASRLRARQ